MVCELFTIVDAAGLWSYKIARTVIDDVFDSYYLHCQAKVNSTSLLIPQNDINEIILVHWTKTLNLPFNISPPIL